MRVEWKGGNLTKKRAAFLCWKMWQWIADTLTQKQWAKVSKRYLSGINDIKKEWAGWERNGGKVRKCDSNCPACEQVTWRQCHKCFLLETWGGSNQYGGYPCVYNTKSPYAELWGDGKLKTAKAVRKRAQIIANAAKKVYEGCK